MEDNELTASPILDFARKYDLTVQPSSTPLKKAT